MKKSKHISLPALRCRMGDWIYYLTAMPLQEISDRVRPVTDMHTSASLNELLQREITKRKNDIARYLLQHSQRFFSSIVVGVYGGSPEWIDITVDPKTISLEQLTSEDAERINDTLGLLHLSGEELLFAIDGQHRVEGIREVVSRLSDIGKEEVGVIFVAHTRNAEGLIRTRRLFSTLNRYAKPVSPGEIVALDEDDAFAIVTRRLMDEHPLLRNDRARAQKQVAISSKDKNSFTTMLTVYNVGITLCDRLRQDWKKKELISNKPSDKVIDDIYNICAEFWTCMADDFGEVDEVRTQGNGVAGLYRRAGGGHVLFRPAGQMAFARAVRALINLDFPMAEAIEKLSRLPYELSEDPWIGVLWNPASKTMYSTVFSQEVAAMLMLFYIHQASETDALKAYSNALGIADAKLPEVTLR